MHLRQQLVKKIAFPVLGRFYNRHFDGFLRLWEETQYWDSEKLFELRWSSFHDLLRHTATTVPFYRDFFQQHGLSISDFRSFEDLDRLPVIGKDDIRTLGVEPFLSETPPMRRRYRDSTSGTSGSPFSFFIDDKVIGSRTARLIRENLWANWQAGSRYVRLWGPHQETLTKKLFYDVIMGRIEVPAFDLDRNARRVFDLFDRVRPRVIEAYTSAAVQLAHLCQRLERRIPAPDSIVVSAETLTPSHRELIERSLGGRVFNRYGSREFGNIAHECAHGGFHINAESFFIEEEEHPTILDASNLLITFFHNYTMPFIRFRIGDLGRLDSSDCSCGRRLPLLLRVEGRETDFFRVGEGRLLSYLFFNHFFEQYGGLIDQYQIEQVGNNRLIVRLIPAPNFTEQTKTTIETSLERELRSQPEFEVVLDEQLVREPSGKLRVYRPMHDTAPSSTRL